MTCTLLLRCDLASVVPVIHLRDKNVANYLMINRLLRMFYLPKYLNDLSTVLGRKGYLNNIGIRRTWMLFFTMSHAGHLAMCGFYFVARQEALSGVMLTWPEVPGVYSFDSTTVNGKNQRINYGFISFIQGGRAGH